MISIIPNHGKLKAFWTKAGIHVKHFKFMKKKNGIPFLMGLKKILRIMRITAVIVFVLSMHVYAESFGQVDKINLKMSSNIKEVFEQLEKVSNYRFVLKYDQTILDKKVDVNYTNEKIDKVLDDLLKNTGFTYKVIDRYIAIVPIIEQNSVSQQQKSVSGKVSDSSGGTLPGVSVIVKGTNNGTISDANGNYSLSNIPDNAVIQFSFVGMKGQEIEVRNKIKIDVTLAEDAIGIEEVVAIGYGVQKKVNLTGAISTISGEDMTKRPVANTATMLQSQVPGLRVSQGRGQPGAENLQLRIRGQGTYSSAGSNPLVLINGVEGDIATLDPNIIESVTVLKDAASAAIYGSRAANGVILVTTKSGVGQKDAVKISYNANLAIYQPTFLLNLIWDSPSYMKYFNLAKTNSGSATATNTYTDEMIAAYSDPNRDKIQYPSFDWIDAMFSPAFVQTHNINTSGTSMGGKTSYNVSLSYLNQPGTMDAQTYDRFNVAVDLSTKINRFIKTGIYVSGSRGNRQETSQGDTDAYLSTISQAPTYMPSLPDDGSGITRWTYRAYDFEGNNKNMFAIIDTETLRTDVMNDLNGQYWLEITPIKGLTWYTKAASRLQFDRWKRYYAIKPRGYMYHTGEFATYLDTRGPQLVSNMNFNSYSNVYSTMKYDFVSSNDAHSLSAMAGYSQEQNKYNVLQGERSDFSFPLKELDAAGTTNMSASGSSTEWGLQSFFSRLNYNYKERYLLEANARYDGTSRIAKENRWGVFPSFSAAWRLTEEQWIKDLSRDWLNSMKIRVSWGMLGNQNISLYSHNAVVSILSSSYPYDNSTGTTGVAQTAFSNRNLKWETTAMTDIGADIILFDGLNLTFDWYNKKTTDILRRAQATDLLGLNAPFINGGEMVNKGIELAAQYTRRIEAGTFKNLTYNAGVYFDRVRNELTKFGAEEFSSGQIRREGLPYNSFYAYEAIGIFKDVNDVVSSPKQFTDATVPGDIKYADVSGPDGNPDGVVNENDRIVVSGRFPNFEYGLNLGINWNGFDLSMLGQGVAGIKHYVTGWGVQPFRQGSPPTQDYIENMWTEQNPNGKYPRLYYDNMGGTKNTRESTFWLHNGSYFRVKNVTVGYTLPDHLSGGVFKRIRVYLSGDNILTFTEFPQGGDPDRNNDSVSNTRLVNYPQNKIYSFGINVEF
jgi:TonB-linked SusC/RagA family outer membrane protein